MTEHCPHCGLDLWALSKTKDALAEMTDYAYELGKEKHKLIKERDEARVKAREYYRDVRQLVTDYQWGKHWANDADESPWLTE